MSGRSRLRAGRLWLVAATVLVAAAIVVGLSRPGPGSALDPASTSPAGSKALATALHGFGVRVHSTHDPAGARGRIVVVAPQDYSAARLRELSRHGELVLFGHTARALAALGVSAHRLGAIGGPTAPGCDWPGATAAGRVDLPDPTAVLTATGVLSCYGGAVLRGDRWIAVGSARVLRNDTVADAGVAALDVNAITDDRTVRDVTWLLPAAASSGAPATVWALFPDGARRALLWLVALGVLLALWRGRRMGRVVTEPLPVLVRAAEVVEGHGRLYLRASARGPAAAALRAAALRRLGSALGLPRGTSASAVAAATATSTGRPQAAVAALLSGAVPVDDAALLALAVALDDLQAAAGVPMPRSTDRKDAHV